MNERGLQIFQNIGEIGDDLILEGGAFLAGDMIPTAPVKPPKRGFAALLTTPWMVAAVACVVVVGMAVSLIGGNRGLLPWQNPNDTDPPVSDTLTEEPTESDPESPTENETEASTENETNTESSAEDETDTEPEESFHIQPNNYNGAVTILYCSDSFDKGYFFETTDSSPTWFLGEAAYERIKQTEEYLGVSIYVHDGGDATSCRNALAATQMAWSDDYQIILTPSNEMAGNMMIQNCLLDLKKLESLDLSASYWSPENTEALSVSGRQLLAYGDFLLPEGNVIGFSRALVNEFFDDDQLYTLVNHKNWTLERMQEFVTAYKIENGDGIWDEKDCYGFSCDTENALIAFQTSSDIRMVDNADDTLTLSTMNDPTRILNVCDMLTDLINADSTYYPYRSNNHGNIVHLSTGRIMFEATTLNDLLLNGDENVDVGILPYPLYDRAQTDYHTLYTGGYIAVSATIEHPDMVGDVLELLAYRSEPVREAYLESVVKKAHCDSTADMAMLRLVQDSMTCDMGLAMSSGAGTMYDITHAIPLYILNSESSYEEVYNKCATRAQSWLTAMANKIRSADE